MSQSTHTENDNFKGKSLAKGDSQIFTGVFIILIGLGILLRRMDTPIPSWMLGWEMLLVLIGLFLGFKNGFKDISWAIPMVIGGIFLLDKLSPDISIRQYAWPAAIIAIGLLVAFKGFGGSRSRRAISIKNDAYKTDPLSGKTDDEYTSSFKVEPGDQIELVAVFGGVKRSVVSKNFMGGEITAIFGGAEVDLSHADIHGTVKMEATNILGGSKLIVPANWDVQSEMVAIFGGVEDKRRIQPDQIDTTKRLILEGTCFLGGLEIKSH